MDWSQFSIFFLGVFGMWLWYRSEACADRREIMQMIRAIQEEIKDFHGRLCALEEKIRDIEYRGYKFQNRVKCTILYSICQRWSLRA